MVRLISRHGAHDAVVGRIFGNLVEYGEVVGAAHRALHGGEDARLHEALIGDEERPVDAEGFEFGLQQFDRAEIELHPRIDQCHRHVRPFP